MNSQPPHDVKLDYFKPSGKWYSSGEYQSSKEHLFEIWDEVRTMLSEKRLPGLIEGHSTYYVQVEVPSHEHDHPHMIVPDEWRHQYET